MTTKPMKIQALEDMARTLIGDGKAPDLYFVTDRGVVVTVTRDAELAHGHWRELANRRPLVESALESRRVGVLASVEPDSDETGARLIVCDDFAAHA